MVEQEVNILTRGGVYLARLDPAKAAETGKIRPVIVLTTQAILDIIPPIVFICPMSRQSQPEFSSLHVMVQPRDHLEVVSYALVEHCRAMSTQKIIYPRLAQLTSAELRLILNRLQRLVGL